MASKSFDYDLVVIGSGAGGSIAADILTDNKWKVAVVEHDTYGGEVANWGSVPMQALLRSATVYDLAKNQGPAFGLRSGAIGYNYPSVRAWKDTAMRRSGVGSTERYYQNKGISALNGTARFVGPHEITIGQRHIKSKHFLIAAGAQSTDGAVVGLDKTPHLTPRTALSLARPPKTLFVIGGGPTGCEFAELFSIFGTKVYIADESSRLLPKEDSEVSELIETQFKSKRGMSVLPRSKVIRIAQEGIMTRVTYISGSEEKSVKVDHVLLAAGKLPVVDLGLENAGIDYSIHGIETNEFLETARHGIYAAGDVLGRFGYAHTGVYESRVVANNLLHPKRRIEPDYSAVPRVTHVTTEIASVGMSEADCLKRDLAIQIGFAPLHIIARANIDNVRDGFAKVITDKKGLLIGATIAAPHAGESIHELTLAIQYGLNAAEVATTLHAFPSWSEAIRVACSNIKTKK